MHGTDHLYLLRARTLPELAENKIRPLPGGEWARPTLVAPGTPPDRVKILRAAHEKAAKDPELLAEAKKLRIDVVHAGGEELQKLAANIMNQPPEVIEAIKKLFVN